MTAQTSTLNTEVFHGIYDLEERILALGTPLWGQPEYDTKARLVAHYETVMRFLTEADLARYEDFKAQYSPLTELDFEALRQALEADNGEPFTESGTL